MPRVFRHEEQIIREVRRRLPDCYVALTTARHVYTTQVAPGRRHTRHEFQLYIKPFPGHEHGYGVTVNRVTHALRKVDQELQRLAAGGRALPGPRMPKSAPQTITDRNGQRWLPGPVAEPLA